MLRMIQVLAFVVASVAMSVESARAAAIVNGGFEKGDFSGWETIGMTSIETSAFGTNPAGGTYHALMTTEFFSSEFGSVSPASLEDFLALPAGTLDTLAGALTAEGSAIKQTITVKAGDVLSFNWNFLTDETTPELDGFNDFAFWTLTDQQSGAVLADTFSSFMDSSTFFGEETGYRTASFSLRSTGNFVLGFGVMDVLAFDFDSGLLIDNVTVTSAASSPVPEPSSLIVFALAGLAVVGWPGRRWTKQ